MSSKIQLRLLFHALLACAGALGLAGPAMAAGGIQYGIEALINDMAGVAESAVVGVPHPDFGEAVVAVVVPRPGAQIDAAAMVADIKSRIANFKVPKRLFVVPDLPRNAMGKVQKNLLREQHKALFA